MGSFTRNTAFRIVTARTAATSYVERIAEEAERNADAAEMARRKIVRHRKAQRKLTRGAKEAI